MQPPRLSGALTLPLLLSCMTTAQMEGWAVSRRYADFSKLNKRLKRLGIIPPAPLPPKRAVSSSSKLGSPDFLDDRRRGLEHYLNSVVIAAQVRTACLKYHRTPSLSHTSSGSAVTDRVHIHELSALKVCPSPPH